MAITGSGCTDSSSWDLYSGVFLFQRWKKKILQRLKNLWLRTPSKSLKFFKSVLTAASNRCCGWLEGPAPRSSPSPVHILEMYYVLCLYIFWNSWFCFEHSTLTLTIILCSKENKCVTQNVRLFLYRL